MAPKRTPEVDHGLPPHDSRRPIRVKRLAEARAQVDEFLAREPRLEDPEFEQWSNAVRGALTDLFGSSQILLRFRQLNIRPMSYYVGGEKAWNEEPLPVWQSGLAGAARVLDDALEDAAAWAPVPEPLVSPRAPLVHVDVSNVFSPSIQVTVSQLVSTIDSLGLAEGERSAAKGQLEVLDAELKGAQRWPIIGGCVDALKTIGKGLYERVALPLLAEYIKAQLRAAGAPPGAL